VIAAEVSMIVAQRGRVGLDLELIEWPAGKHGGEIVVTNQQSLSPQQQKQARADPVMSVAPDTVPT
jgi:hypothetical protein